MRVIDASEYRFLSNDEILVDTNFWLLTYDVLGSRDDRGYAELLDYIVSSRLYVTDLILSEFIHASTKIAYRNYCKKGAMIDGITSMTINKQKTSRTIISWLRKQ